MDVRQLYAQLSAERDRIDSLLTALEPFLKTRPAKRPPKRALHWTQRPENRRKMQRIIREMAKAKKRPSESRSTPRT